MRKDAPWMCFTAGFLCIATCSSLMNNALGRISSHDSPPPPCAGNGGRRRTCWREMCWLKSIEVEDKKINSRKVSLYFGIYQSTFVFILNSGFFMSYFEKCLCIFLLGNLTLFLEPHSI